MFVLHPHPKVNDIMKKYRLKLKNIILLIAFLAILALAGWYISRWLGAIPQETYTNSDFDIETYISPNDKDGDGVDDQTDILENVRAYVATKPKYMSKYYPNGYPDDEYGVCTDVVAQGLLGAGYDLRELVDADRSAHPEDYADEPIDKNIDFRRVRNLIIYFRRHATELTTDIYDIAEWQGGDIVVFEGHIGIVSDKRNKEGIAFVIHNGSSFQLGYEQDILENRKSEIVGHFRVG